MKHLKYKTLSAEHVSHMFVQGAIVSNTLNNLVHCMFNFTIIIASCSSGSQHINHAYNQSKPTKLENQQSNHKNAYYT